MMAEIILLDLAYTLVENSRNRRMPFRPEEDEYRQWLVELVRPYPVFLVTARRSVYREATMERIRQTTGWEPLAAFFNPPAVGGTYLQPPQHKERVLHHEILPHLAPGKRLHKKLVAAGHVPAPITMLAIESNQQTHAMYRRNGIACVRAPERSTWWKRIPQLFAPPGAAPAPGAVVDSQLGLL